MPRHPSRPAIGSRNLDATEVARHVVDLLRGRLRFEQAILYVWEPGSGMLRALNDTKPPALPVKDGEGLIGRCFHERRSLWVEDYRAWGDRLDQPLARSVGSALAVPLLTGAGALGVLAVSSRRPGTFAKGDLGVLRRLAGEITPAVEAACFAAQQDVQARIFGALQELAAAASGTSDPRLLGRRAIDKAAALLGVETAFIWIWDADEERLRPLTHNHDDERLQGRSAARGEGAIGQAFDGCRPLVVNDYENWSGRQGWATAGNVGALVVVPLLVGERPIGVIGALTQHRSRQFGPEDVALIGLLGAQVAPALEAARLLEQTQAQVSGLEALQELAVLAAGVGEAAKLAQLAVNRCAPLLACDLAQVRVVDAARGGMRLVAVKAGWPWSGSEVTPADVGVLGEAFRTGAPARRPDPVQPVGVAEWAAAAGIRAALAVPLIVGDRVIGGLAVGRKQETPFSTAQVRLLALLAAQIAPALDAAERRRQDEQRRRVVEAARALAAAASGMLEPAAVARLAVDRMCELLNAQSAALAWTDRRTGELQSLADNQPQPPAVAAAGASAGEPTRAASRSWSGTLGGAPGRDPPTSPTPP